MFKPCAVVRRVVSEGGRAGGGELTPPAPYHEVHVQQAALHSLQLRRVAKVVYKRIHHDWRQFRDAVIENVRLQHLQQDRLV